MTDAKLKRANELKKFIEQTSEKLSDLRETERLSNTPYGKNQEGKVNCVDLISGELSIKWKWNQKGNEQTYTETLTIPTTDMSLTLWQMLVRDMEERLEKAVKEYEAL